MNYDDEFEGQEPETVDAKVKIEEGELERCIKVSATVNPEEIVNSVVRQIRTEITEFVREAISTEVKKMLIAKSYYQKDGEMNEMMRGIIKEVVREKFETVYPDAVSNQLNKMVEEVKKITLFSDSGYSNERTVQGLKDQVQKKIDAMLAAEIKPLVAEQAKTIQEQVQANFAQNFIRTMIPLGLSQPKQ